MFQSLLSILKTGFAGLVRLVNPACAVRRKLAILALAASFALSPSPASAQVVLGPAPRSDSDDTVVTVLVIAGIALLVAVIVVNASKDSESAFGDSADEIPDHAESPISLGSFRLSERDESAHYGAKVRVRLPLSAQGGILSETRRESESGLLSELARLPENALAKVNASSWAQSGWSFRPALDAASLRDADQAKFLFQVERRF